MAVGLTAVLLSCSEDSPVAPPSTATEPSLAQEAAQERPTVVPGEYIIQFRDDVDLPPGLAQALADQFDLGLRHEYGTVFQGFSARVPEAALDGLRNNPFIASIEPNHIAYLDYLSSAAASVPVPGAGLRMRLVADDLALADGADVDVWPNSGSEGDPSQSSSRRRPTYHAPGATGMFGGHAHVGLNEGGDDDEYLQVGGVGYHGSATLIAVFNQEDATAHNYGLVALYGNNNNRATFATMFDDQGDRLGYWDSSNAYRNSQFITQPGDEHIAVWRVQGSQSVDFQVDGVAEGSVALPGNIHDPFTSYVIGSARPGGNGKQFDGQVAEIILYDRALPDCERDQIVTDLGAQYGISVSTAGGGCLPPTAPSGLSATTAGSASADVGWTDTSGNEDGFTVERRLGQVGSFEVVGQVGADTESFLDTGLAADTEYCYRAQAFNGDGSSPYSNVDCATTDAAGPPPPPVDVPTQSLTLRLVADQLSLGDGAGVDVWSNLGGSEGDASQSFPAERPAFHAAGATGKFGGRAHVGFNEGGDDDEYLEVPGVGYHGSATVIAVFSQEDQTAHNYSLVSFFGSSSSRATFATMFSDQGGDPLGYWDPTNGYRNSTFSLQPDDEHVAVWRVEGSQGVDFQVDGTDQGSLILLNDIQSPFSSYVVGRALPGVAGRQFDGQLAELIVYSRAIPDCEQDQIVADLGAQYGIDVSTTGGSCAPPAPPSGATATTMGASSAEIDWVDNSGNETGFTIERREGQSGSFQAVGQVGANVESHLDTGLSSNTEYCYRVVSFNGDGSSAPSNVDCTTTDVLPPTPPPIAVPGSGLRLRLVADQLSLTDGADVDAWANLGGSEGDAAQVQASQRPAFHQPGATGMFGGRAHVGFNEGGDDDEYLQVSGVGYHYSATLIAVFSQDDKTAHNYGLASLFGSSSSRATFATMFSDQAGNPLGFWDSASGYKNSQFSPEPGDDHVAVWRLDGSLVVDFQVDGIDEGSVTMTSAPSPFSSYVIGTALPGIAGKQFDGQVAELLLYDRALPDCERDQIVTDLGARYGISVSGGGGGSCSAPAGPTGLSATALDHASAQLDWTDQSANEDGFSVERREGQAGAFAEVGQVGPDVETFLDNGLAPDTEYCYRIVAFNGDGTSPYSNVSCATTDSSPPPPSPVTVPGAGLRLRLVADQLPLADGADVDSWANLGGTEADALQGNASQRPAFHAPDPTGSFGGRAHVGFNEGGDDDEYLQVSNVQYHGSATLIAVFSQEDATAHNYGILALHSSASDRATFSTMFSDQAGNPLGYWDITNEYKNSQFSLQPGDEHVAVWRVEGSQWVDFQVDGADEGSVALASDIHNPFQHYVIGTGLAGTNRQFDGQVAELILYDRALLNCERDGIVADLGTRYGISVSVTGTCNTPAAPSALSASALGSGSVEVQWTDNSGDEDGFTIERREGQAGAFTVVGTVGADVEDFVDSGLIAETEYCYRVQAFNGDGPSTSTNIACATTGVLPPPPAPINVPGAGLRLRLVADQLSLGQGADVDTWPNEGGTVGDATQDQATQRPTFYEPGVSGKFGGRAHVGFNEGADDDEYLQVPGVAYHGSATVIAVFSQEDQTAHNYGLVSFFGDASSRTTFATMFSDQAGNPLGYWDISNAYKNSQFTLQPGDDHVAVWRVKGSQAVDFQVDGADQGSVPLLYDIQSPFSTYVVGTALPGVAGKQFDGQLAELIVYNRALLDCERDQIVEDLGGRYSVSVPAIGGGCMPPAAPSNLAAAVVDYRTISLSWTDGSNNEDGFTIERREGQTGSFETVAQVGAGVTTFDDGFLLPEREYCYRVSAFNGDGFSAFSNVDCGTTPAAPPGACFDTGNHDDLAELWNISRIEADQNPHWQATQLPGCQILTWIFTLDSGVDSDHPDLNVAEVANFVASEPANTGEDGNGHGTHVAGIAAALDGNGGVVGVAPGAPIHAFRVCFDDGSCQEDDIIAAVEEVTVRKLANPSQPMVANMSLAGDVVTLLDQAVRESVNAGVVYALGAGNGIIGACIFPADAQNVSPAGVGDDDINGSGGTNGNTARINGVLTTTLSTGNDTDGNCNYGNPVTIAAPGDAIKSSWLGGGYNVIGGTSMASPHAAGAAALRFQEVPNATPVDIEQWIVSHLDPWSTDEQPNADGRLNVRQP